MTPRSAWRCSACCPGSRCLRRIPWMAPAAAAAGGTSGEVATRGAWQCPHQTSCSCTCSGTTHMAALAWMSSPCPVLTCCMCRAPSASTARPAATARCTTGSPEQQRRLRQLLRSRHWQLLLEGSSCSSRSSTNGGQRGNSSSAADGVAAGQRRRRDTQQHISRQESAVVAVIQLLLTLLAVLAAGSALLLPYD